MPNKNTAEQLDLSSPAFISNPYPTYKRLREFEQPYWQPYSPGSDQGMWLFSRYEQVETILQESRKLSNNITPFMPEGYTSPLESSILQSDADDHLRLRRCISEYFKLKNLRTLEPLITKTIARCFDKMESRGGIDFVSEFAADIPFILITTLMGIPQQDFHFIRECSASIITSLDHNTSDQGDIQKQQQSLSDIKQYFSDWLKDSAHIDTCSISYDLIQLYRTTDRLSRSELLTMLLFLLIAGHENVANTLSSGLLSLLENPQQKTLLQNAPDLMGSAIEEILRYVGPVQRANLRITTVRYEIDDFQFDRGAHLSVILAAANRDPEQFSDPDRFDITRKNNRHLAFGSGIHTCLGAMFSRMQLQQVFSYLLQNHPNIRLAEDGPRWKNNTLIRSLESLPVYLG